MLDTQIVIDHIELHTNVANIIGDQEEYERGRRDEDGTIGRTQAFWTLRMALQKRAVVFRGQKFVVIGGFAQKPDYQQTIKLLEQYKIGYTTFI